MASSLPVETLESFVFDRVLREGTSTLITKWVCDVLGRCTGWIHRPSRSSEQLSDHRLAAQIRL